jgi:hypothetical protein
MFPPLPSEPELLKQVLAPLLEDFQYWFDRSQKLLETSRLSFIGETEQQALLNRIVSAQKGVAAAQSLLIATDGQAGVEMTVLMGWHRLVAECWAISMKHRSQNVL